MGQQNLQTATEEIAVITRDEPIEKIELFESYYVVKEVYPFGVVIYTYIPLVKHSDETISLLQFRIALNHSNDLQNPESPFDFARIEYNLPEEEVLQRVNEQTTLERPPLVFVLKYGSFRTLAQKALRLYGFLPDTVEKLEKKLERTKEVLEGVKIFEEMENKSE